MSESGRRNGVEPRIAVVKIGGSVLTGAAAYRRAAGFLANRLTARPDERLVVVVSAEKGVTDELLRLAQGYDADPDPQMLDLLWSTGELRSVAILGLALRARGIRAAALNVHQSGVLAEGPTSRVRVLRLRALLAAHEVVVVPGFLACGPGDAIVSLGRGGSDLSAVILAAAVQAARCELIKDVNGYYDADPHERAGARHLPAVDSAEALDMADAGCDLVQKRALAVSRQHGIPLVVRALDEQPVTTVSHGRAGAADRQPHVLRKPFTAETAKNAQKSSFSAPSGALR